MRRNILPVLFSAPMVAAILREIERPGTGKTQTRRALAPLDGAVQLMCRTCGVGDREIKAGLCRCGGDGLMEWTPCALPRFRVNDVLYVREPWRVGSAYDEVRPLDLPVERGFTTFFEAGGSRGRAGGVGLDNVGAYACDRWPARGTGFPEWVGKSRRAMHLPRSLTRITLAVTGVRVEALHTITEADAIAEGVERYVAAAMPSVWGWLDYSPSPSYATRAFAFPRESYRTLWDAINGAGAWDANPWVAVYTFRPILGNVDDVLDDPVRYGLFPGQVFA